MRTIEINVTQEDIDSGALKSCTRCPIALAMRREFVRADVRREWAAVRSVDFAATVPLPASAIGFISRFDDGKPVKPFTFRIEVP